ncbi:hypothetical protein SAMN02927900_06283 [Rhizobium mongolense subsp. loessense]|uniref:Porin n=1 Tax=Rhizobium mongolense subsp. loessense TaxID=158890 RepID=A0A1G4U6Y9_9HYPH|nr:hypothetical protein SAMN02927900_06283 [Rhizobium mongolense subsp. loessense]
MINRLAALPVIFLVSLPAAAGNYRPDNGCTLAYPQSALKNGSVKLYSTRTCRFSLFGTVDENQMSGIGYVKAVELLAIRSVSRNWHWIVPAPVKHSNPIWRWLWS